jgi:hypothetical protein
MSDPGYVHDDPDAFAARLPELEEKAHDARAEADFAGGRPGLDGPAKAAERAAGRAADEAYDLRKIMAARKLANCQPSERRASPTPITAITRVAISIPGLSLPAEKQDPSDSRLDLPRPFAVDVVHRVDST